MSVEKFDKFTVETNIKGKIVEFKVLPKVKLNDAVKSIRNYLIEKKIGVYCNLVYKDALLYIIYHSTDEEIEKQYQEYLAFLNQK